MATKACDLCGQPISRIHPVLCAECYYKFWERARHTPSLTLTVW